MNPNQRVSKSYSQRYYNDNVLFICSAISNANTNYCNYSKRRLTIIYILRDLCGVNVQYKYAQYNSSTALISDSILFIIISYEVYFNSVLIRTTTYLPTYYYNRRCTWFSRVQFNSDTWKHESCNLSANDLISPVSVIKVQPPHYP